MSSSNDAEALQLWRSRLRERLREGSEPIFASGQDLCPAASMWVMMRQEVERMRQQSVPSVPLPVEASIPGLATLLAALWLGLSLKLGHESSPVPPGSACKQTILLHANDLVSALIQGLSGTVNITKYWGNPLILSQQLLPALFAAEIIRLGPCHHDVETALRG